MRTLLLLLLLPFNVCADNWSTGDTWREMPWQIINFIDYKQTLEIARNPKFIELNPILGENPSEN
jgi:hypothetical protein